MMKRAIANSCSGVSVRKPCAHRMIESLDKQASKLWYVGYPTNVIVGVTENIIKNGKNANREEAPKKRSKNVRVIPYIHRTYSDEGSRQVWVNGLFSAPYKLGHFAPTPAGRKGYKGAKNGLC